MSITNERIKEIRKARGITQEELAKLIGMKNKSSISKIENPSKNTYKKERDMTLSQVKKFAEVLNTTVGYLMGWSNNPEEDGCSEKKELENLTALPIAGNVAAGNGCYLDDDIIGMEYVPTSWINPSEQYVLLKVKGDSMYPKFEEDDLLLVKLQSSVDSGSYAVALIDNEDGVVKRVIYDENRIELISINPMYPPRIFEGSDVQRVRIFGVIKKDIRDI